MSAPYPQPNQPAPAYQPGMMQQGMMQPGMPQPGMQPVYTQQPGMQMQPGMQPVYNQQPGMQPVYNQQPGMAPQQGEVWMAQPEQIPGCPPGLEYLTQIDQLLVKQKVEVLELLSGMETANKYQVKNSMGQDIYKAKEKSGFCGRQICGPSREFEMEITDNSGREVIHVDRPLKCNSCCCFCCLQEVTVSSPISGEALGSISQQCHFLNKPTFDIQDASGTKILQIEGPLCPISCCGDVNFKIFSNDEEIGKITKQWTGLLKEAYTDADNFGVTFPLDLDVKIKAVCLGAVFLIDFMYFEQPANNNN